MFVAYRTANTVFLNVMMEVKRCDPSQWLFQKAGPVQCVFLRQHVAGLNSISLMYANLILLTKEEKKTKT